MANRKRNIQIKFYVTEDEKRLIDEKMSQLPTRRYGAYLRKMAMTDISSIRTPQISRHLPKNFPPLVGYQPDCKRINAGGPAYQADMDEIRERLDEIWQLQRHILSSQR